MHSIKHINKVMCGCRMAGIEFLGVGLDRRVWFLNQNGVPWKGPYLVDRVSYVKRSKRLYFWGVGRNKDYWSGVERDQVH